VPPYCGLPRLSHQFPVALVVVTPVVAVVVVVTFGVVVVVTMAVVVVVVMGCVVVDAVVVFVPHEAKNIEPMIRRLINTKRVCFFTCSSFFILRIIHPKFIF